MKVKELNGWKYVMSSDGLIAYNKQKPMTIRFNREETNELLETEVDYSKYDLHCEVAHCEVANTCNLRCPGCYTMPHVGNEMDTLSWKSIFKNLSDNGIFQVSYGGGEPTLRKDILELAAYIDTLGMNLGMTTNGAKLDQLPAVDVRQYFKQINVSWHNNKKIFTDGLRYLKDNGIPRGINYCLALDTIVGNDYVKDMAREYDAELLYLVYKPVDGNIKNQVSPNDVYKTAKEAANQGLRVAVDGPAVHECLAKKKFIDVDHRGTVFQCSFVRKPMGNLLAQSFKDIWKGRGKLNTCPWIDLKTGECITKVGAIE